MPILPAYFFAKTNSTAAVKSICWVATLSILLSACGGRVSPQRSAERDKAAAQGGGYCNFVSGVEYPDVEVELSLQVSKKCDMKQSFSLTEYRTDKNNQGVLFCCGSNPAGFSSSNSRRSSTKSTGNSGNSGSAPAAAASDDKASDKILNLDQ